MQVAGIEVEALKDSPEKIHVFPRGSRRGKPQWAIWVHPDGSGVLFIGSDQVLLPKNEAQRERDLYLIRNADGAMELISPTKKIWCTDAACPHLTSTYHEFGKGCRLF